MSLVKDEINDTTTANMEYEDKDDKVKVEEVYINLGCVKQEYDEAIDLEGNSENKGFEGDVVLIETAFVKTEDIKEETTSISAKTKDFCCNKCGRNYQGYCSNCSTLSHILNKIVPTLNIEADLKAVPTNILELKDILSRKGIFTLKILPNGVIFGPFKGASTSTNGWKIKDSKFITEKNANWMKYIACASNQFSKNLDIFQLEGSLYFQTNREIKVGEELLICYTQEALIKLEKEDGCCFVPVVREESWKIFACTLCCLGFRLESCLMEHKSKCPHGNGEIEDFEVIECNGCKLWLEKREHQESHMLYCIEKTRTWGSSSNLQQQNQVDEIHGIDEGAPNSEDASKTNKNLFQCHICNKIYSKRICLKQHIRIKHSYKIKELHKCYQCSFQSEYKSSLERHLIAHTNIRPYQCEYCAKKFVNMSNLKDHVKYQHSLTGEKEFKCPVCLYQTNRKGNLKLHLSVHSSSKEKKHKCEKCQFQTNFKSVLNVHLYKHEDKQKEKHHKCPHCSFQTFYRWSLKTHLNTHETQPANKNQFDKKSDGNPHMKIEITAEEANYKCTECPFQTTLEDCLRDHMNTHVDLKPFQCDVCKKKFREKKNVYQHIRYEHSSRTNEKKYKCLKCSYQTNYKNNLMSHFNTHKEVKPYQCGICDKSYAGKKGLEYHMKNTHVKLKEENFE